MLKCAKRRGGLGAGDAIDGATGETTTGEGDLCFQRGFHGTRIGARGDGFKLDGGNVVRRGRLRDQRACAMDKREDEQESGEARRSHDGRLNRDVRSIWREPGDVESGVHQTGFRLRPVIPPSKV